jgi:hypothetical protein
MAQYRKLQRCLQYWPWSLAAFSPDAAAPPGYHSPFGMSISFRTPSKAALAVSLVVATYAHIGRNVSDPDKRFAGNNFVRAKRHLKASLKKLAGLNWANGRRQRSHKISRPFSF